MRFCSLLNGIYQVEFGKVKMSSHISHFMPMELYRNIGDEQDICFKDENKFLELN